MVLVVLGVALLVGLGTLLWRQRKSGAGWRRELGFFVDLIAMAVTALVVGSLVLTQLQDAPEPSIQPGDVTLDRPTLAEARPQGESVAVLPTPDNPPVTATPTPVATPAALAVQETGVSAEATETPAATGEEESDSATATPEATPGSGTPEPSPTTATEEATATPEPTVTPTPQPSPTATAAPAAGTRSYTVQPGDTLGLIAKRLGVTNEAIIRLNPGMNADSLSIGQVIVVPAAAGSPSSAPAAPAATAAPAPPATRTYTVQSGDRLGQIAQRFGVTNSDIIRLNPSINPDNLRIGQVLVIPAR
jgi:LysM repeat protein